MSALDVLWSFSEARAHDDEIVPGFSYRMARDLYQRDLDQSLRIFDRTAERNALRDELAEWKLRALTAESMEEDAQQAAVRFKAERDKLDYELTGVMHSVDKWFDEVPDDSPAARAADARAIALTAIEQGSAERDKLAYMIEYIESLDPVIVGWARAGFQQEAKP